MGNPTALYLELTLQNDRGAAIPYDASRSADRRWELPQPIAADAGRIANCEYAPLKKAAPDGTISLTSVSQATYLKAGQLTPGSTVAGWLAFKFP